MPGTATPRAFFGYIFQRADSGEVAWSFRDHVARCSDMMSPA
jgi:hypothetical protein